MLIISADALLRHRGFLNETLVMSWDESDQYCKEIEKNIRKLGIEFKSILSMRTDWKDLCSCYFIPANINLYTVFYMTSFPSTGVINIGIINNPNYDQLKNFYLKCKNAIECQNLQSILPKIKNIRKLILYRKNKSCSYALLSENNSKIKNTQNYDIDTNEALKFKIYSKDCEIFQFIRRKHPSIFYINIEIKIKNKFSKFDLKMLHQMKNNISESDNILKNSPNKFIPFHSVKDPKYFGNKQYFDHLKTKNIHLLINSHCEETISSYSHKIDKFNTATQNQFIQYSRNTTQEDIYPHLQFHQYPFFNRYCQLKKELTLKNGKYLTSNDLSYNYSTKKNFSST